MRRRALAMAQRTVKPQVMPAPPLPDESPAEAYMRKFGKPPHHRMKPETIAQKVQDRGNAS